MTDVQRSIYVTRQTIVEVANQVASGVAPREAWTNIFENYPEMGIDQINFEANPHYLAMYESDILEEYPFLQDRDYTGTEMPDWNGEEEGLGSPMESATQAAHELGLDVAAWQWTGKAHNTALNEVIGEDESYRGSLLENYPELSTYSTSRHPNEEFLDFSDQTTMEFAVDVGRELASEMEELNINILKPDYIRGQFGSRNAQRDSVTEFIERLSGAAREENPDISITPTVFPHNQRIHPGFDIGQEWETWTEHVDGFDLMMYARTADDFAALAQEADARLESQGIDDFPLSYIVGTESYMGILPDDFDSILQNYDDLSLFSSRSLDQRPWVGEALRHNAPQEPLETENIFRKPKPKPNIK